MQDREKFTILKLRKKIRNEVCIMESVLIGISAFFSFIILRAFIRHYFRFKRLSREYKKEYAAVLTDDRFKVKGRFG